MGWLFSALGVVLALAGAASIISGIPYVRLEFGWTEVIAGTTALSAGIVTMALGSVLFALQGVRRSLVSPHIKIGPAMAIRTVMPFADDAAGKDAPSLSPGAADPEAAPDPASGRRFGRLKATLKAVGVPKEQPQWDRDDRSSEPVLGVPPRLPDQDAPPASVPDDRGGAAQGIRPSIDPPSSWRAGRAGDLGQGTNPANDPDNRDFPENAEVPARGRTEPSAAVPPGAPTVVGRYESGGASYVLFSDGTIEVETDTGTHRFASMQELRDHIGQQATI